MPGVAAIVAYIEGVIASEGFVGLQVGLDALPGSAGIVTAQMSLAKGLEFRATALLACDEGVLPLDERISDAADEAELDDI